MRRRSTNEPLPKGYTCTECGTTHVYPAYVYAHWDVPLTHTCDCLARFHIISGIASLISSTPKEPLP